MSKLPTKDEARAAFWKLAPEIEALQAQIAPLREKRDAFVNKARAEEDVMNAEIKKLRNRLGALKQEQSGFAKLAGTFVGQRPELNATSAPRS